MPDGRELEGWRLFMTIRSEERHRAIEIAKHGEIHDPKYDQRRHEADEEDESDDDGEAE